MDIVTLWDDDGWVLRRPAEPVQWPCPGLGRLVAAMVETMYANDGFGLAAPQVGVPLRIFVVDVRNGGGPQVFVNPSRPLATGTATALEGCLSVPGIGRSVERGEGIYLGAAGVQGNPFQWYGRGLKARVIQHEIDHLDGVLITDVGRPGQ